MERKKGRAALRALAAVAFALVFALLLSLVSGAFRPREALEFYSEPRNTLDVLFLGSSHMLNAVSPMELWRDYGMASCNLAENGQLLPVTYYVLLDALRRQSPKLVVVDVYKVVQDTLYDTKSYLHVSLDAMPMGAGKLRAVYGLLPAGERTEFLFDLVLYHDRWRDPEGLKREGRDPDFKGCVPLTTVDPHGDFTVLPESETAPPPQTPVQYLEKIVELCREKDVELLFIAAPFTTPVPDDMDRQQRVNAVAALAEAWGVPFVNMMHTMEEMGFDLDTDLADTYHANVSGMKKVTAYLGAYIAAHYAVPDRRGDSRFDSWDAAYRRYENALEKS